MTDVVSRAKAEIAEVPVGAWEHQHRQTRLAGLVPELIAEIERLRLGGRFHERAADAELDDETIEGYR